MAATTAPADHERADVGAPASLMNSCTRMLTLAALKASMMDFAEASVSARITPMPCVPSSSLMTHRRAADLLQHVLGFARAMREGGHRQADAVARQQLQGAQFVARPADGDAFVQRKDALHLELAQHGQVRSG